MTVTIDEPGVPCASTAVTTTVWLPAASVAGALNANGGVISTGVIAIPSTVTETIAIMLSSFAVTLIGKPACTLAPCFGVLIVTTGGVGVPGAGVAMRTRRLRPRRAHLRV